MLAFGIVGGARTRSECVGGGKGAEAALRGAAAGRKCTGGVLAFGIVGWARTQPECAGSVAADGGDYSSVQRQVSFEARSVPAETLQEDHQGCGCQVDPNSPFRGPLDRDDAVLCQVITIRNTGIAYQAKRIEKLPQVYLANVIYTVVGLPFKQ